MFEGRNCGPDKPRAAFRRPTWSEATVAAIASHLSSLPGGPLKVR